MTNRFDSPTVTIYRLALSAPTKVFMVSDMSIQYTVIFFHSPVDLSHMKSLKLFNSQCCLFVNSRPVAAYWTF